jgi:hypothetical protein
MNRISREEKKAAYARERGLNRILLKEKKATGTVPVLCSKFFGMPDVLDEFEWPIAFDEETR